MATVELFAPAKLNLHLSVGGIRPDGFHDVTTVLQAIGLGDTVTADESETLAVTCVPDVGVPIEENLVHRAVTAFAAACGRDPAVTVAVRKAVPAGAGLGGGSSDAAAAIRALARLWGMPASDPRLRETATAIGADVPFFLGAPAALMAGRGDDLERELGAPVFNLVVVWPRTPVSTADAYAAYDSSPRTVASTPDRLVAALEGGDWRDVAARLHNDMTEAACTLVPDIGDALALLDASEGVVGTCMCGSGSAVFGISVTEAAARVAAEAARGRGWWAAVTRSLGGAETIGWNERRGSRAAVGSSDEEGTAET